MNLLANINHLDSTSQRILWKGLANSSTYQLIRALEFAVREHQSKWEPDLANEEAWLSSLDTRNEQDNTCHDEVHQPLGLGRDPLPSPREQAQSLFGLQRYCSERAEALALSKWEEPMSFRAMLKFRAENAPNSPLDSSEAFEAIAEFINVTKEQYLAARAAERESDKVRFLKIVPDIFAMHQEIRDTVPPEGYEFSFEELPLLSRHRFYFKTLEVVYKEWTRILKRPTLEGFATLGILNETAKTIQQWIDDFEDANRDEIGRLVEDVGLAVPALSDLKHRYPLVKIKR
jgi:hypothetical protein